LRVRRCRSRRPRCCSRVVGPAIVLQGSSQNIVLGNRACGGGPVVPEQTARCDNGSPARSLANQDAHNRRMDRCSAGSSRATGPGRGARRRARWRATPRLSSPARSPEYRLDGGCACPRTRARPCRARHGCVPYGHRMITARVASVGLNEAAQVRAARRPDERAVVRLLLVSVAPPKLAREPPDEAARGCEPVDVEPLRGLAAFQAQERVDSHRAGGRRGTAASASGKAKTLVQRL
jgi:hypothetical protein